jgi:hypothetical protein
MTYTGRQDIDPMQDIRLSLATSRLCNGSSYLDPRRNRFIHLTDLVLKASFYCHRLRGPDLYRSESHVPD